MKQKLPISHLVFLGLCVALSLVTKRLISPLTNFLTDLIRIPGGGAATAFSLMFLAIGTAGMRWRWATTAAGFVQALIALALGMSAYQGAFALVTYTLPGLVIDLVRAVYPHRSMTYFVLACGAANTAGAALTNLLVFRLEGVACLLWLLVACTVGVLGGMLGQLLFGRIIKIPEIRRLLSCQENG